MSENDISYGGQAVISGVLIQSPKGWSVAVRNQNNEIVKFFKERTPLIRRKGIFTLPLIRGIGALVDSLYVGYQALTISDEIYYADEPEPSTLNKILNYLFIVSFLSILIAGPRLLIDLIDTDQTSKGIYEGLLRGVIVVLYIYVIGKTKDAQELFEFHGAEHMTIAAFENNRNLDLDNIKNYPKEHIRCGTAFIFLIVFVSLLTLPFIPTLNILLTLLTRILHVFVVAMISYEILKLNFKFTGSLFSRFFSTPGIWMQKMTTKIPSEEQIEVARVAMANCIKFSENTNELDQYLDNTKEVSNG